MHDIQFLKELLLRALGFDPANPPAFDDEMPLFGDKGLGLDSIDAMAISTAVKTAYGVNLEAYAELRPVYFSNCKSLMCFIEERLNEQRMHELARSAARNDRG